MNFNSIQWFDSRSLIFMAMSLTLNFLIAYLWHKKIYRKLGLKSYKAIQRIHLNETPRLGGIIFILSLVSLVAYCGANENIIFLKLILTCLIPIIIIGLKEDLFHNVEPAVRLISLLFAAWLFRVKFTGPFPNLTDVPLLGKLLILQGGVGFFYILSITGIANGMNLIDGVNGLCGAVTLSILFSLLFLSYRTYDVVMLSTIFSLILILVPFIIINYPYGKIFLGDLGAYGLGFIVSALNIIFFGRHPEISPWGAALILIYPATEVVFSTFRRIFNGTSIFHADTDHLHLKIFYFFRPHPAYRKIANSLVAPVLSCLWLFPLVTISWGYNKPLFIWTAIVFFLFLYTVIYFKIPKYQKYTK